MEDFNIASGGLINNCLIEQHINPLPVYFAGHIKSAEQQQYGDCYTGAVGWAVTFGIPRRGLSGLRLRPVPSSLYHRRPVYQLHIIRCGTITAFAL